MTPFEKFADMVYNVAAGLTKTLQEPWVYQVPTEETCYLHIKRPDGARLYFYCVDFRRNPTHVEISGSYHIGKNGQYVRVANPGEQIASINVAIARGVDVMVKEITRRLLPKYLTFFARAQAQVAAEYLYDSKKAQNLRECATALGKQVNDDTVDQWSFMHGEIYGWIRPSDNTVSLELRCLTPNQAKRVLAYIADK